jgi:hypothetical protein
MRQMCELHLFPMRFQERLSVCREREQGSAAGGEAHADGGASPQKQAAMLSRPSAPMRFLWSTSTCSAAVSPPAICSTV